MSSTQVAQHSSVPYALGWGQAIAAGGNDNRVSRPFAPWRAQPRSFLATWQPGLQQVPRAGDEQLHGGQGMSAHSTGLPPRTNPAPTPAPARTPTVCMLDLRACTGGVLRP